MNSKKKLKFCVFIVFIIILAFFTKNIDSFVDMYIAFAYPCIRYKGDKTVKEDDIIHLEKILLRDLRLDHCWNNEGKTELVKYFIIKNNHMSKKKLKAQLLKYSKEYYTINNYDKIVFFFYEESGTMPWYWNNEGYFPDLEMNSDQCVAVFSISGNNITFRDHY